MTTTEPISLADKHDYTNGWRFARDEPVRLPPPEVSEWFRRGWLDCKHARSIGRDVEWSRPRKRAEVMDG